VRRQITQQIPQSPSVTSAIPLPWCVLSCATESFPCVAGEIVVLRVSGEVDLCTLPTLQNALDHSLDQHPAHLVVDLAQMAFCSGRGLDVLAQTRHTAADNAISYAVSGALPHIDRLWTLLWDSDLPVRRRSTTAAVIAIWAAEVRTAT
jgi:anti-anti-sigma factor